MGAHLSRPVTEKLTESGENSHLAFAVASMQGWRTEMEDAHICEIDLSPKMSLFGVFDGHGGKEVALFTSRHIVKEFLTAKDIYHDDIGLALKQSFLSLDRLVAAPSSREELNKLSSLPNTVHSKSNKSIKENKTVYSEVDYCVDLDKLDEELSSYPLDMDTLTVETESDEEDEAKYIYSENQLKSSNRSCSRSRSSRILAYLVTFGCLHCTIESSKTAKKRRARRSRSIVGFNGKTTPVKSTNLEQTNAHQTDTTLDEQVSSKSMFSQSTPNIRLRFFKVNFAATTAGCTAIVAAIMNNSLYVANAGDSRCVLCHDGIAISMSRDHKPTDTDEFSRIATAGGFVYEGRVNGCLNLSRAIGDLGYKKCTKLRPEAQMITANPEVKSIQLRSGDDFIILACDGIWDVLSRQQACDFVLERLKLMMKLQDICTEMCDYCLADNSGGCGEGCDNMTVVIVLLKDYSSH